MSPWPLVGGHLVSIHLTELYSICGLWVDEVLFVHHSDHLSVCPSLHSSRFFLEIYVRVISYIASYIIMSCGIRCFHHLVLLVWTCTGKVEIMFVLSFYSEDLIYQESQLLSAKKSFILFPNRAWQRQRYVWESSMRSLLNTGLLELCAGNQNGMALIILT